MHYLYRIFFLNYFIISFINSSAQRSDSIKYDSSFKFEKGFYLSFKDFKNNSPIPTSNIIGDFNLDTSLFLNKISQQVNINYINKNGDTISDKLAKFWGATDGRKVFYFTSNMKTEAPGTLLNRKARPLELIVIGDLCLFRFYYNYDKLTSNYPVANKPKNYIVDFNTGKIVFANKDNVDSIFKRDENFYKEYKQQKGSVQGEDLKFIIEFNQRHPIYFRKKEE